MLDPQRIAKFLHVEVPIRSLSDFLLSGFQALVALKLLLDLYFRMSFRMRLWEGLTEEKAAPRTPAF